MKRNTKTPTTTKPATIRRNNHDMQAQLGKALDHTIEGCQIISAGFRYIYVNQTVAKQGHSTVNQLLGRTMMEVYPGIEHTEMFKHLRRCMRSRRPQSMENEFRFPDGSKGWFELKMEPVPEGALILSGDITKRKRAEESLLEAVQDLQAAKDEIELEKITDQAILQSIGEGLVATDSKAKIIMVNRSAERLLGIKASELVGGPLTRLVMLDEEGRHVPASKRPIYSVLRTGVSVGPSVSGNYFVNKHSGKFPVGLTATPINLKGKIIGAIGVFRDISKEQEIDKAKTEFVSIASHQLRTPLGLTKWYLEAVRQENTDSLSTNCRGYLDEIYKSNERVLKVVRELLSVSRIDQGRVKDNPKVTDLAQLVKDVVHEMLPVAAIKQVKLSLKTTSAKLPSITIDQMRLHEVIQNLIANAVEYTPAGGSVTVSIGKRTQKLIISVADTGIGIDESDQKRLFTKFFRSEKAASQNPNGSGLGLYVVRSYVEAWGGTVSVKSHGGEGTTFTVALPIGRKT